MKEMFYLSLKDIADIDIDAHEEPPSYWFS